MQVLLTIVVFCYYCFLAPTKLQREIEIHRSLTHENICEFKRCFEDERNVYILLELCPNLTLNHFVRSRGRLTEPEAAFFMRGLVGAIQYLHENSIIHRDLKPQNIFLDKNMNIRVGDLGLATRLKNEQVKCTTFCGTPNYIAPEVIQDKESRAYSYEVDVWSMGVILYYMLVGTPPFEARDVKATYVRIRANDYDFPSHSPVSQQARELIVSMLQSNPENR